MIIEHTVRSIAKSASYRALGTAATALIVLVLTGRTEVALAAGGLDVLAKIVLDYVHERVWGRLSFGRREQRPTVVWFTGLPGSGKTAIARRVHAALHERGLKTEYLDGDAIRGIFPDTGFGPKERDRHIRRVGHLASTLERHGVFVVAAFVSPTKSMRGFVRSQCRSFVEVHVATPLEVCEKRDPKGHYAKARRGELPDFTGVSAPYEEPSSPEVRLETQDADETQSAGRVLAYLDGAVLRR